MVYRRFRRWACMGLWDELFVEGIPTDALETVMVDSTACKAQRFASGARGGVEEDLGRSRGGLTTKIHALVDGRGRPCAYPNWGSEATIAWAWMQPIQAVGSPSANKTRNDYCCLQRCL